MFEACLLLFFQARRLLARTGLMVLLRAEMIVFFFSQWILVMTRVTLQAIGREAEGARRSPHRRVARRRAREPRGASARI